MASVLRSALVFAFASTLIALSVPGCADQAEGERCDRTKAQGSGDCDSGLTCVPASELLVDITDRCCPPDGQESTDRCTRKGKGSSTGGSGGASSNGGTSGSGGGGEPVGGSPEVPAGGSGGSPEMSSSGAGGEPASGGLPGEGGVPGAGGLASGGAGQGGGD
jgi:hypothetical protein